MGTDLSEELSGFLRSTVINLYCFSSMWDSQGYCITISRELHGPSGRWSQYSNHILDSGRDTWRSIPACTQMAMVEAFSMPGIGIAAQTVRRGWVDSVVPALQKRTEAKPVWGAQSLGPRWGSKYLTSVASAGSAVTSWGLPGA